VHDAACGPSSQGRAERGSKANADRAAPKLHSSKVESSATKAEEAHTSAVPAAGARRVRVQLSETPPATPPAPEPPSQVSKATSRAQRLLEGKQAIGSIPQRRRISTESETADPSGASSHLAPLHNSSHEEADDDFSSSSSDEETPHLKELQWDPPVACNERQGRGRTTAGGCGAQGATTQASPPGDRVSADESYTALTRVGGLAINAGGKRASTSKAAGGSSDIFTRATPERCAPVLPPLHNAPPERRASVLPPLHNVPQAAPPRKSAAPSGPPKLSSVIARLATAEEEFED